MKNLIIKTRAIQILFIIGIHLLGSCRNERKNTPESEITSEIQNEDKHNSTVDKELLVGSWKDYSEFALHFTLFKDGSASSDNMKTLLYKTWEVNENKITFTVESIGNGTSFIDNETYIIDKLTKDSLILKNGEYRFEYFKE
ncbi:lipocalin family protein [Arenibacter sp. 6A1]|uniref:lipocalin family protein n=1 Tax=Arenibacter sp. 6A1 TaxID=2720391 RepID=UPI0014482D96|nr:lipocalin family protein [Arenibacter sp. 6A1]NKI27434.1 lipocalin family protein [Arenibacter sp. 6A1]